MLRWIVLLIAVMPILGLGCVQAEKVRALEQDSLSVPYDSIGTLEVKTKARGNYPTHVWNATAEAVSLGHAETYYSQLETYKTQLRRKLAVTADKRYDADAVINVKFWPDLDLKEFADGFIYARGEMVRYKRFPDEKNGIPAEATSIA